MLLPAVAAEVGSKEPVLGMIGVENLSVEGEGAVTRTVDGGIQSARTGDELVELEGEERLVQPVCDATILLPQAESEQRRLERRPSSVQRSSRLLLERLGGVLDRLWSRPGRLAVDVRQSETSLDPDRERIARDLRIAQPEVRRASRGGVHGSTEIREAPIGRAARISPTLQCLGDDRVPRDRGSEELGCDLGDELISIVLIVPAHHRGRSADADWRPLGIADPRTQTAHQHGDVGALASAIGMQLVEHHEAQTGAVLDDLLVKLRLPGHQQLEHHEIRQQDVRRIVLDLLALLRALLAGVPGKGHSRGAIRVAQELPELFLLAVGERVHGIDDDRACAGPFASALRLDDGVDDRNEVAERLSGPGTGRHHEALAGKRKADRLDLVSPELEAPVGVVGPGSQVAENLGAFRRQPAHRRQDPRSSHHLRNADSAGSAARARTAAPDTADRPSPESRWNGSS